MNLQRKKRLELKRRRKDYYNKSKIYQLKRVLLKTLNGSLIAAIGVPRQTGDSMFDIAMKHCLSCVNK